MTEKPSLSPLLRLLLDVGPLVLFFVANARPVLFMPVVAPLIPEGLATGERAGIFVATAVFMTAVIVALAVSYAATRQLPVMALVSTIIVLVFGSLTLFLHDETFIKLKPTLIYALFGATLLAGLMFDKPLIAVVFDAVFHLTAEGWRRLTVRWAVFFFAMAALNEIVWRNASTDFWVSFKLFGFVPLTLLFAAMQYPLLQKYAAEAKE